MVRTRRKNNDKTVHKAVNAVKKQYLTWRTFTPPMRQPIVNRNFTFPFTTTIGHQFTGTGTTTMKVILRVENVIKAVCSTVDMSSSWYPLVAIRVHSVSSYGVISSVNKDVIPAFVSYVYDPITGTQAKSFGTQGEDSRSGVHFPTVVSEHLLQWDGTGGTSAEVLGVSATGTFYLASYWFIVVTIDRAFSVDRMVLEQLNQVRIQPRRVSRMQQALDDAVEEGSLSSGAVYSFDNGVFSEVTS